MSEIPCITLEQALSMVEIARAEMVPGGVAEGMLASFIYLALERYDAEQDSFERYVRQVAAGSATQDGLGPDAVGERVDRAGDA